MTATVLQLLISDLKALGLKKDDTVLVHSSLRSLGRFANKAEAVTDALLEVLGPNGTLLMPALTYKIVTKEHPVFNSNETSSCVGGLTEYFRKRPGVKRSLHPTHSVCAIGKHADHLLKDHYLDCTPCGVNSPFSKLREVGGHLLFLGCSLNTNTSMHGVEELSAPPYLYGETLEYTLEAIDGKVTKRSYKTHNFQGYEQRYNRVLNILSKDDYAFGKVVKADAYLLKSNPLWEKAHGQLMNDPFGFVDRAL